MQVHSQLGEGTSFRIYLPVAQKNVEATPEPIEPSVLRGGGETILLAEDDEALGELARNILTGLGYSVLLARDGQEAVEMFTSHRERVDLVILDFAMPHMGGREAYERIRGMGSDVSVLFATGYSAEMAQATILEDGDVRVMQKPYSVNELGRKVRNLLDEVNR